MAVVEEKLPSVTLVIEWENAIDVTDKWTRRAMVALMDELAEVAPEMPAKPRILYLYDDSAVPAGTIDAVIAEFAPRLREIADVEVTAAPGLSYYKLKNFGISQSTTPLTVMVDSDAAPQPGWLRNLLAPGLLLLRLLAPALELIRPRRTHRMRGAIKSIVFGAADADPATIAMTQELLEGPPLSTVASLQGALLRHDMLRALERLVGLPVLVLTGSDDRLTRPEHSRRMADDIGSSAELVIVPGAGHVVNQTRPVQTNAALDWLLARATDNAERSAAPGRP
mgnify:CR=1 FL=1